MIHVRVRDEDLIGPQQPCWAQTRVVAEIEEEGTTSPLDLDIEARVPEGLVDEIAGKCPRHKKSCFMYPLNHSLNESGPAKGSTSQWTPG